MASSPLGSSDPNLRDWLVKEAKITETNVVEAALEKLNKEEVLTLDDLKLMAGEKSWLENTLSHMSAVKVRKALKGWAPAAAAAPDQTAAAAAAAAAPAQTAAAPATTQHTPPTKKRGREKETAAADPATKRIKKEADRSHLRGKTTKGTNGKITSTAKQLTDNSKGCGKKRLDALKEVRKDRDTPKGSSAAFECYLLEIGYPCKNDGVAAKYPRRAHEFMCGIAGVMPPLFPTEADFMQPGAPSKAEAWAWDWAHKYAPTQPAYTVCNKQGQPTRPTTAAEKEQLITKYKNNQMHGYTRFVEMLQRERTETDAAQAPLVDVTTARE